VTSWISFNSSEVRSGMRPVVAAMRVAWPIPWKDHGGRRALVQPVTFHEVREPHRSQLRRLPVDVHTLKAGHPVLMHDR
jgi:hypothetical protein